MTDSQKRYETERHALFFKEEACKQLYKDHVKFMVNRVNSYTGVPYRRDPTILAWNLINEPRCETWVPSNSWCPETLAAWFKVRAGLVIVLQLHVEPLRVKDFLLPEVFVSMNKSR